jgi:hypothetical protein
MIFSCHTNFSLLYGTARIETLIDQAKEIGINWLAITDINNTTGCFDFLKECRERKIKPILGIEFRDGDKWLYTCLARNNNGFKEINDFQSSHNFKKTAFPKKAPKFADVFVIYPFVELGVPLSENEFIGVRPVEINRLLSVSPALMNKCVAFHQVTFTRPSEFLLHMHLRAMDLNTLLTKLPKGELANPDELLIPTTTITTAIRNIPNS